MHITMAGKLGSGKSTIAKLFEQRHGFEIYSTGKIQRELARGFGLSTLEMNQMMSKDTKYDRMIDDEVTRISLERANDKLLFDSRMAWHFAKNTFKVFFTIDPQVAALRVMDNPRGAEETYADVDEAREKLILRGLVENERFKEIYGTDNLAYSNYDLIVDTSYATPDEICKLVNDEYEQFCKDPSNFGRKMYFSPKSLYPTESADKVYSEDFSDGDVCVCCEQSYNYIVSGHKAVLDAVKSGALYITAKLTDEESRGKVKESTLEAMKAFEEVGGFKYPSYPPVK